MGRRVALLIGNQVFSEESGLQPLRGPINDVDAIGHVLGNPELGGFEIRKLLDKPHYDVVRALVETLQTANSDDFVLIFYSGHGKVSTSGKLYLATADTDQKVLQATAVPAWTLHEAVNDSLCKEVVLLLDCCYSGAVSKGLKGNVEGQLRAVQNAAGFFILTASTSIQTASENEADLHGKVMGRFTAAIVEGIQSGRADAHQTGEIRLSHLKTHVERTLRGQTPQFFAHAGSGDPFISRSAKRLPNKDVYFSAVRDKMLGGVNTLANSVKITLGPKGRMVAIGGSTGTPRLTKNGFLVAKGIELNDRYENLGAQLIRGAASQTGAKAGDGTTTAIVLAQAILFEGLRFVKAGVNPTDLKHEIDQAVMRVVNEIKAISKGVSTHAEIAQVRAISANGDRDIVDIVAKAMDKVGNEGTIVVQETDNLETEVDLAEGVKFDGGHISPYFITNAEKSIAEFDDAYVLLHNQKLSALNPLLPILEALVQTGHPLVVVAPEVSGEALATLIVNKLRGGLQVAAVKAPGFGDRRKAMLQDIAILTGGQVLSEELGIKLESVNLSMLGRAKKGVITSSDTTVVCGPARPRAYRVHVKSQIDEATSDYDREKLLELWAEMYGRVAMIRLGGKSEIEVKEKRTRLDEALSATRAAVKEGIVPGGGVALLNASKVLSSISCDPSHQAAGVTVIRNALQTPTLQIAENAGVEGQFVVDKILENGSPTFGFDAQTKQYVDLIQAGIIDAAMVVRTALEEATSIAGVLITTEGAILEGPAPTEGNTNGMLDQGGAGNAHP
jgi:chaperonin GroEL